MKRWVAGSLVAFVVTTASSRDAAAQQPAPPPPTELGASEAPTDAQHAEPSEAARAEALRLFDSGRAMMQQAGKLTEACDTLTKSYELHNRGDTLLNLAECHRRQGKTATAWREFDEAIRYAEEVEFTEAIAAAGQLRDALAKDLSELLVDVTKDPPRGLVVILDGKRLPKEQWGQKLFVDPGTHAVSATADGFKPFDRSTEVKKLADRAVITVRLEKLPPPPPPPRTIVPPPPVRPDTRHVPTWSLVVGGVGVAALGAAVGFGVDTVNVGGELDRMCGMKRKGCPSTYDFQGARTNELRSFGLFVGLGAAGIGAVGAGVVGLVMGVTGGPPKQVAFTPWVSPTSAGFGVSGVFR